jgi:hypothetical protein
MERYMNVSQTMPRWVWWVKGECVVEVLGAGHFPTTIMVKLPDDKITEIECNELENNG